MKTAAEVTNVLICGTGGQGILLASEVLSGAARASGMDIKKSEVHGMAQRGGSVTSHVRFGSRVFSPLIEEGTADVVLGMEQMEGLRWLHYMRVDGTLLIPDIRINPVTVNIGAARYPDVEAGLASRNAPYRVIPALAIARELGNTRVVNLVMLGAASTLMPMIGEQSWMTAIERRVPAKALGVNMEAFERGKACL
ncbi:indolepyruvate oxidoreductase subunit beta [Candidatus Fermentibacterales bacterium]|nr:indolepyruvate oxidoreductase subunit beta [Candidatus Fermentibacterales bacterium]